MMELFEELSRWGFQGALIAILLYIIYQMQTKLFSLIENNTKALEEMRNIIEKCQLIHKE